MKLEERERLFAQGNTLRLMIKYAIPTIIGMTATSLNIFIDRMFVGNIPDGSLAIAGISVSAPLVTLVFAINMMAGAGGGANVSLAMGRGDSDAARTFMGNALLLGLTAGTMMIGCIFLFMDPLLTLFGASAAILPYARVYLSVCMAGSFIHLIGFGLNRFILAQGMPSFSMISNILTVAVNVLLDPIFLFVFQMGIVGAALATALGQFSMFVWVFTLYGRKKVSLRPSLRHFKPKLDALLGVAKIGAAPGLLQILNSLVAIALNMALSVYGGDPAISAMGIVTSIQTVVMMPVFGINQGAQPIIGYNYGAKLYGRVKKLLLEAIVMGSGVIVAVWLIIMIFAEQIMKLAGAEGQVFSLGVMGLRTYLMLMPLIGFQIVSAHYFQAVGRPVKSMMLSISRQGLFYIPALFLLPRVFGLSGVLYAAPVSDGISAVVAAVCIVWEMKRLGKAHLPPSPAAPIE